MTRSPKLKLFATSLAVGVVKFALTVTCAGAAEQAQFIPVNFPHCSEMPGRARLQEQRAANADSSEARPTSVQKE